MATETVTIAHKTANLSHGVTHYYDAGTGEPLILLHGSGIEQGGADFLRCMDVLGRELRVLAPDFVGWPPSDTFGDIASFPYLVDFVREFQDALGLEASHIVGVSMGGWIAGLLAYESPERVTKVVVCGNPGLYGSPNHRMAQWQPPTDEKVREWVESVSQVAGIDGKALLQQKLVKLHEAGVADAFGKLMRHMADDANRQRYALDRRLPHIKVPALFLWGVHDNNTEHAAICQQLTPGSQSRIVEAGHRMHIEDAALFSNAIMEFLR